MFADKVRQAYTAASIPQCVAVICAYLLLHIVVVGAGQQVAKDQLRHVHALLLVHLHGNAVTVVPHLDGVGLLQDQKVQEAAAGKVQQAWENVVLWNRQ
jgi:hypothetical protein